MVIHGISQGTELDIAEDKYNYGLITVEPSGRRAGYYKAGMAAHHVF